MLIIKNDPKSEMQMRNFHTDDELEDLSEIFNEMMSEVRSYSKRQEQFVSDVSHELRTPVAIVEGHLSMLNRWGKNDPKVLNEGLDASLQEIKRMKSLIQEMLELTRTENIDPNLLTKTTKGGEILHQVVNNFRLLYPDFEIQLDDRMECDPIVQIYRNHLEQIAIIILENAIKYSTDKHRVDVTVSENDKTFTFSIRDYGEGISEEDLKQIYNRFFRVDKSRVRTTGGNGLGLPIAKGLVDVYSGKISVESQLEEGTTFTISLPLAKEQVEK